MSEGEKKKEKESTLLQCTKKKNEVKDIRHKRTEKRLSTWRIQSKSI